MLTNNSNDNNKSIEINASSLRSFTFKLTYTHIWRDSEIQAISSKEKDIFKYVSLQKYNEVTTQCFSVMETRKNKKDL